MSERTLQHWIIAVAVVVIGGALAIIAVKEVANAIERAQIEEVCP